MSSLLNNYKNFEYVSKDYIFNLQNDELPLPFAVVRMGYYHTFIIDNVTSLSEDYKEITIIHKINKTWKTVVASIVTTIGLDYSTAVKKDFIRIKKGKEEAENDTHDLFNFKSGVCRLGRYSKEEREKARGRAYSKIGDKEIYSTQSANCEHFTSYCFLGRSISFQTDKGLSILGDVALETVKNIMPNPLTIVSLAHSCISMKEDVNKGQMTESDMDREVTKKTFGTAGSYGAGIGGAVIGTLLLPGIGTIAGAAIGNVAGRVVGTLAGMGVYGAYEKVKK